MAGFQYIQGWFCCVSGCGDLTCCPSMCHTLVSPCLPESWDYRCGPLRQTTCPLFEKGSLSHFAGAHWADSTMARQQKSWPASSRDLPICFCSAGTTDYVPPRFLSWVLQVCISSAPTPAFFVFEEVTGNIYILVTF